MLPSPEEFSQFLTQKICNLENIADSQKYFVDLYISLQYGNAKKPLSFTYAFAKTHGLFPEAVQAIEEEVKRKFRQKTVEYVRRERERYKRLLEEYDEGIVDKTRRIKVMREKDLVAFGTKDLEQEEKWLADMQRDKERYVAAGEPAAFPIMLNQYMMWRGEKVFEIVPPDDVPSQVLTDSDIEKVKAACLREFDEASTRTINVIREFVEFCNLLSKPENHIRVRSGQFIERELNLRGEQDMVNEAALELTGLAKYTAYAKVLQDQGKSLWAGEIRTLELRAENDVQASTLETFAHVQLRGEIENEIRSRHDRIIKGKVDEQGPAPATY